MRTLIGLKPCFYNCMENMGIITPSHTQSRQCWEFVLIKIILKNIVKKKSSSYIKVFHLNSQNIAVGGCKNARNSWLKTND